MELKVGTLNMGMMIGSHVQLLTGRTARMVRTVNMFGTVIGFVHFNVCGIVDGNDSIG